MLSKAISNEFLFVLGREDKFEPIPSLKWERMELQITMASESYFLARSRTTAVSLVVMT